MTVACIIIAGGKGVDGLPRTKLLDEEVIPSVVSQSFDECVVVGSHHEGEGYRYLHVPDITSTTLDALIKRDVGTAATSADILVYLSDDHALVGSWGRVVRQIRDDIDVVVPTRLANHPERGQIRVPNGDEGNYCAGHCGVFRRRVIQYQPWAAQPHHRNWDLLASYNQGAAGFTFAYDAPIAVIDLEPERCPWK